MYVCTNLFQQLLLGGALSAVGLVFAGVWVSFSWFSQSYSLGKWMEEMEVSNSPNGKGGYYFTQYMACACSVLLSCSFRSIFQIASALVAARKTHEKLLKSTLLASCAWFDSTPIGRIINRFSQDITTIDSSTMVYLVDFLDCLLGSSSSSSSSNNYSGCSSSGSVVVVVVAVVVVVVQ